MYTNKANNSDTSNKYRTIDLRSDTVSKPSDDMREAMANAAVGDDVYGEDPTVLELQKKCAQLFEKEAALFVPSGTMANLLSVMVHCNRRGSEIIVGNASHIFLYEQASAAHVAGVQINIIENKPDGTFCLEQLKRKIRFDDIHEPITAMAVVENTHNMCGGKVIPLSFLDEFTKLCKSNKIATHMDGARIFNAATSLNVPVSRIVRDFDSVCFCLSKGLCAPVGSILVGSADFIREAHRYRKALGGGMRQVGHLAAAGLVALKTVVPVLHVDHKHTKQIADAIYAIKSPNVTVEIDEIHSNILMVQLADGRITSDEFTQRLSTVSEAELVDNITDENGKGIVIKIGSRDWHFARLVLYRDITQDDVQLAIKKIAYCINEIDNKKQINGF